jgi:hypothetical protein
VPSRLQSPDFLTSQLPGEWAASLTDMLVSDMVAVVARSWWRGRSHLATVTSLIPPNLSAPRHQGRAMSGLASGASGRAGFAVKSRRDGPMPTDLGFVVPNRPGALKEALTALSTAKINIDFFCADLRPGETWGSMHVLVQDAKRARAALESTDIEVTSEHEVDVVATDDRQGTLASVVQGYAAAGRDIEVLYTPSRDRVVIGAEEMKKPRLSARMEDARF